MRRSASGLGNGVGRGLFCAASVVIAACGASSNGGFIDSTGDGGAASPDTGAGGSGDASGTSSGGPQLGGDAGTAQPDATTTVTTIIYGNTDDSLYRMDPQSKAVTLIGQFAGMDSAQSTTVTDVAVNGNDEVFVNTESAVYKAQVPAGTGTVQLTKIASISVKQGQRFYALGFTPEGVLGSGETLIGGDGLGELWSIDTSTGATRDLGSFGPDPRKSGNVFGLSGDVVFYVDANKKPTGLATIRSCPKGSTSCATNDYLAGIDMTALASSYTSGTPATSLLAGIYGGSATNVGNGTGFGDLFGLGAWQGDVYAFERAAAGPNGKTPQLVSIDTGTGTGTVVPSSFSFTNGWSGAGVTTKVSITIPPPPPPPK